MGQLSHACESVPVSEKDCPKRIPGQNQRRIKKPSRPKRGDRVNFFNESAVSAIANVGEKRSAPPAHGFLGALESHNSINSELEAVFDDVAIAVQQSVVPVIANLWTPSQVCTLTMVNTKRQVVGVE